MAKGFKGRYFSLQAITAIVNAVTLHGNFVRTRTYCANESYGSDASIEESPPDYLNLLEALKPFTPKVSRCQCHCNCFFRRRTACALYLSALRPKLRFLFRYFNTDSSPPLYFFSF